MNNPVLPTGRFLATLRIVHREGSHLAYSWRSLFGPNVVIDAAWVETLEDDPERAVRLEAFVSRFGRMQDTIAGKLIPRWLHALAEPVASQIENLDRAERLGVLDDVNRWLELRKLRNRLVHEYMEQAADFAEGLCIARDDSQLLFDTYNRIRAYAKRHMGIETEGLPPAHDKPCSANGTGMNNGSSTC